MLGAFVALDLFVFYVFWEVMLIPMYFIIGIWGGERRLYASIKFVIYTLVGSLLMLVAILYLYVQCHAVPGQLHDRPRGAVAPDAAVQRAGLVLRRVRAGVRDQGAALPAAHLVARRARRGADRRLGDPGRRAAEVRHLRLPALRDADVPARRGGVGAADRDPRGDRHHLRRADGVRAGRRQEAGRVLVGLAPRVLRARHLHADHGRHPGRDLPDAGARHHHGRPVPRRSACSTTAATRAGSPTSAGSGSRCRSSRRCSWSSCWPRWACPALCGFVGEFLALLGTFTAGDTLPSGVLDFPSPRLLGALAATGVDPRRDVPAQMFQKLLFGPLDKARNGRLPDLHGRENLGVRRARDRHLRARRCSRSRSSTRWSHRCRSSAGLRDRVAECDGAPHRFGSGQCGDKPEPARSRDAGCEAAAVRRRRTPVANAAPGLRRAAPSGRGATSGRAGCRRRAPRPRPPAAAAGGARRCGRARTP